MLPAWLGVISGRSGFRGRAFAAPRLGLERLRKKEFVSKETWQGLKSLRENLG